jgi:hypothetical protein
MFGNHTWFQDSRLPWGISPVNWKGKMYFTLWAAFIVLPFLTLLGVDRLPESIIWLVSSKLFWFWDVRQIHSAMHPAPEPDDVFVIDENTDVSKLATRNYDMRLR